MREKHFKFFIFFLLLLIVCNLNSQEELKSPEKDEVVNRIKNDIQQYNEKWQPEVRKLLLKGDVRITKEELDSLLIIIIPTFKIKANCLVKSELMSVANNTKYDTIIFTSQHYYNYIIVPDSNKHTIYSSFSDIYHTYKCDGIRINVYTKDGKMRYSTGIIIGEDNNTTLHILKYNSEFVKPYDYSDQYLLFYIKSSITDNKAKSKIDNYNPIKNDVCVIYNNRIYALDCLRNKFLTSDLNVIFQNNPCNICDCDIDVYFRINEKADEKK